MQFYAYIHYRPNGIPFYVGKGHRRRAWSLTHSRNRHHLFIVNKHGKSNIKVSVLPCSSEKEAFQLEVNLIKAFGELGIPLANKTSGGEGASGVIHGEDTRRKMATSKFGNKYALGLVRGPMPESQRAKLSATRKKMGIIPWNKGIPLTPQIAAAQRREAKCQ